MLDAGTEVDRYVVVQPLGEGGMATVYLVRHATLGTLHALKVLSIRTRNIKERLILEGRVQAQLRHPHVVAVTDVLEIDGAPGLLMEYVPGPSLDRWLSQYQPTLDEALAIFRGVCAGVGHAHAKGLVHRDLKPANVLLAVQDHGLVPKVTDFGLAKALDAGGSNKTRSGATMGTPAYMSPEQIRDSSKVDRRADLYSLGCILYELACGQAPYEEGDLISLFSAIAAGDHPPPRSLVPDLPDHVVRAIEGLLHTDPNQRIADCGSLLDLLGGQISDAPRIAAPPGQLPPPPASPSLASSWSLPTIGQGADVARRLATLADAPSSGSVGTKTSADTWAHDESEAFPKRPLPKDFQGGSLAREPGRSAPPVAAPAQAPPKTTTTSMSRPPAWWLVVPGVGVAGLGVAIGLCAFLIGAAILWWAPSPPSPEAPPAQRIAERPAPAPAPVAAPAPVVPDPAPAQVRPSAPEVVASEGVPVSASPAPAPAAAPAASSTGGFSATGAESVVLLGGDGARYQPGERIPAGTYQIQATFPGAEAPAGAGQVVIHAGVTVALRCDDRIFQCRP